MLKNFYFPLISFTLIVATIYISFERQLPKYQPDIENSISAFSTDRALLHLAEISKNPHYVGAAEHLNVRNYLVEELKKMGLSVEIQEQEVYNFKWKAACKTFNVLAKIKGTDTIVSSIPNDLLLLTHYDSAPHTKSLGASDAGSGVTVILESVRAYLASGIKPKNDIIILFSDAEEIGLLGAKAFVEDHEWAKDVALVLNLEARGSGGPSYMFLETNGGNAELIKTFGKAKLEYPIGNSLMYSIYKMLPNDTDLTVFRELKNIDGFNFAFIDDHFDYHTEQDSYDRLDKNSLKHQGEYMFALLNFFAVNDLTQLKSTEDDVYFNFPFFEIFHYPFSWVLMITIFSTILFISLFAWGVKKQRISLKESLIGFVPFFTAFVLAGFVSYLGWRLILRLNPDYKDFLHGFTYNGHWLIMAFISLSIFIFMAVYKPYFEKKTLPNLFFAPIFTWVIINLLVALYLKGAGFFNIPLIGMLFSYTILIFSHKISDKSLLIFTLFSLPGLIVLAPLTYMLPVGLGLKMLFISSFLTVLLMGTLINTLHFYKNHKPLIRLFLVISILTFSSAFLNNFYSKDFRKPNSIVFYQDHDKNEAYWASYDEKTDDFTKQFLGDSPQKGNLALPFSSKYGNKIINHQKTTPLNLAFPSITKSINDSLYPDKVILNYEIKTNRNANLFYITTKNSISFFDMAVNGASIDKENKLTEKMYHTSVENQKLVSYYLANGVDTLNLELIVPKGQKTELELYEVSLDLMENLFFNLKQRPLYMMPKPFVVNDAVILKTSF